MKTRQEQAKGSPGGYRLMPSRFGPALLWLLVALAAMSVAEGQIAEVPAARRIMLGDRLRITVKEDPEISRIYAVAGDGTIDFPMIGRIRVADLTVGDAADFIERKLEESFFKKATVKVEVAEFVEGSIMVLGAVRSPGVLPFKGDQILTLLEAITMCGGLMDDADASQVRILRWKPGGGMQREVISVDVRDMFNKMDFGRDQFLRPRDIVFVPALGEGKGKLEFLALGEVGEPGFHAWVEGMDVIRAITVVGGVTREAQLDACRLLRNDGSGNYIPIPIDLSRLLGSADMSMNTAVLPGDIIFVPSAKQASRGQVYLLGEVAKRGAVPLPLNREETLARLILRAGGFSKFANENKVKLIRTAPDGSRQTLIVDVGRILKTGNFDDDIPLRDGDVIIVPERILLF